MLQPSNHVVLDGHGRERVRALEDHADGASNADRVDVGGVDIRPVEKDGSFDPRTGGDFVHSVQGAKHRGLTATGRTDQGSHAARGNRQGYRVDGMKGTVIDVEIFDVEALCHGVSWDVLALFGREEPARERREEAEECNQQNQCQRGAPDT